MTALVIGGIAVVVIGIGGIIIGVIIAGGKKDGGGGVAGVYQPPNSPIIYPPGNAPGPPNFNPGNPPQGFNPSRGNAPPGPSFDPGPSSPAGPPADEDRPGRNPPGGNPTNPSPPENDPLDLPADTRATAIINPPPKSSSTKAPPVAAGGQLSVDVLNKVKRATVLVRATIAAGEGSGSGFFVTGAKDIILTNAHVVGMLKPDTSLPKKLEVVLNSGEKDEATFRGDVIVVDRGADLAMVKITPTAQSKNAVMPDALSVTDTQLLETQQVFICGFPLGEQLGKNTTIAASNITSLRKSPEGELERIQVGSGMHPGNSGGPVVDAAGNLVGVAVAGIPGTSINFVIPAERVSSILNGRLTSILLGEPVRKGKDLVVPVEIEALDPLQRIRSLSVDWWWGDPSEKAQPQRGKPTGGTRQTVALKNAGPNKFKADVIVSATVPANKVLWLQASYSTATEQDLYAAGVTREIESPPEAKVATIVFRPRAGQTSVELKSTNRLTFRAADETHSMLFNIETVLPETMSQPNAQQQSVASRFGIQKFAVGVSLDDKPVPRLTQIQQAIQQVGQVFIDMLQDAQGNTIRNEGNLSSVPQEHQKVLTRLVVQMSQSLDMAGITFPNAQVRPGFRWQGRRHLPLATPGDDDISTAVDVIYTYRGIRKVNGKDMAVVSMAGKLQNNQNGQELVGQMTGTALVDLSLGRVAKVNVNADSTMRTKLHDPQSGRVIDNVQIRSRLDVRLTRQ